MNSSYYGKAVGDIQWGTPPTDEKPPVEPPKIRGKDTLQFTDKDMRLCQSILEADQKAFTFQPSQSKKRKKTIFVNTNPSFTPNVNGSRLRRTKAIGPVQ